MPDLCRKHVTPRAYQACSFAVVGCLPGLSAKSNPVQKTKSMKNARRYVTAFARVFVNLYYFGPWRNRLIRAAEIRGQGRSMPTSSIRAVSGLEAGIHLARLRADGFSGAFQVDTALADEIVARLAGDTRYIVPEPHLDLAAVRAIVFDPSLQHLLRLYFGTTPHLFSTSIFITNPSGRLHNAQRQVCTKAFHYDVPDVKGLTLFVYLNDVDEFGGAHTVIPGTASRLTWHRLLSRFMSHRKAVQTFGSDAIVTITGAKGTAFLEDLANWHRRNTGNSTRYALAATYTLARMPRASWTPPSRWEPLPAGEASEASAVIRPLPLHEGKNTPV